MGVSGGVGFVLVFYRAADFLVMKCSFCICKCSDQPF